MSKPWLGLVTGAILGALDGLSAWFSPEARPQMLMIVLGSTNVLPEGFHGSLPAAKASAQSPFRAGLAGSCAWFGDGRIATVVHHSGVSTLE
jgi:hypothetical protein